jgi:hypothetical protein
MNVDLKEAAERVMAWLHITREDGPGADCIIRTARGGSADFELRRSDVQAVLAAMLPIEAQWAKSAALEAFLADDYNTTELFFTREAAEAHGGPDRVIPLYRFSQMPPISSSPGQPDSEPPK